MASVVIAGAIAGIIGVVLLILLIKKIRNSRNENEEETRSENKNELSDEENQKTEETKLDNQIEKIKETSNAAVDTVDETNDKVLTTTVSDQPKMCFVQADIEPEAESESENEKSEKLSEKEEINDKKYDQLYHSCKDSSINENFPISKKTVKILYNENYTSIEQVRVENVNLNKQKMQPEMSKGSVALVPLNHVNKIS